MQTITMAEAVLIPVTNHYWFGDECPVEAMRQLRLMLRADATGEDFIRPRLWPIRDPGDRQLRDTEIEELRLCQYTDEQASERYRVSVATVQRIRGEPRLAVLTGVILTTGRGTQRKLTPEGRALLESYKGQVSGAKAALLFNISREAVRQAWKRMEEE